MSKLQQLLAAPIAMLLFAACGSASTGGTASDAGAQTVAVVVTPAILELAPSGSAAFVGSVTGTASQTVSWSVKEGSAGGVITAGGLYTAPETAGTYHVVAASTAGGASAEAVVAVVAGSSSTGVTLSSGSPLVGTAHSPMNLPISYWAPSIQTHYSTTDLVDWDATADLQAAFANVSSFSAPYFSIEQVSFEVYYSLPSDPLLTVVDASGTARTCPLDGSAPLQIHVPSGAHVYTKGDDQHLAIVDAARNRIYAYYAESGVAFGISGSTFIGKYSGCDVLHGDDAVIAAQETAATRYACGGGWCGMDGIGAGVPTGGNGDSNGLMSPHAVIQPEDFDDTGWTGEAVGTLHHVLHCNAPNGYQHGWVWPTQSAAAGTAGRVLRNGQILRLDPAYVVPASPAWAARIARTMQVYGCMVADYSEWGLAFSAQGNWAGLGPNRGANPWSTAGGAPAEASAATSDGTTAIVYIPNIPTARLQAVLPIGAAH